jgi:hypothetical protein
LKTKRGRWILTKRVGTTNADARINTLVMYASLVRGALVVCYALWSAVGRMADVIGFTRTYASSIDGAVAAVGTTLLNTARLLGLYK